MDLKLSDNKKTTQFETIFKNLKNIANECTIEFKEYGIYIQTMDVTHAMLIEIKIEKKWFNVYNIKEENKFGIHCETFFKILNCLKSGHNIELKRETMDSDILEVIFDGNNNISKIFELSEIQIEQEKMDIPNMEYQVDLTMNTDDYSNLIKELLSNKDTLANFIFIEDTLFIKKNKKLI